MNRKRADILVVGPFGVYCAVAAEYPTFRLEAIRGAVRLDRQLGGALLSAIAVYHAAGDIGSEAAN